MHRASLRATGARLRRTVAAARRAWAGDADETLLLRVKLDLCTAARARAQRPRRWLEGELARERAWRGRVR